MGFLDWGVFLVVFETQFRRIHLGRRVRLYNSAPLESSFTSRHLPGAPAESYLFST